MLLTMMRSAHDIAFVALSFENYINIYLLPGTYRIFTIILYAVIVFHYFKTATYSMRVKKISKNVTLLYNNRRILCVNWFWNRQTNAKDIAKLFDKSRIGTHAFCGYKCN